MMTNNEQEQEQEKTAIWTKQAVPGRWLIFVKEPGAKTGDKVVVFTKSGKSARIVLGEQVAAHVFKKGEEDDKDKDKTAAVSVFEQAPRRRHIGW